MATTPPADAELFQQMASFVQHKIPRLFPGSYKISVQQTLEDSKENDITVTGDNGISGLPSITKKFGVWAPRYSLDQSNIQSVFPPQNSIGEFSNTLPHVVLENETLPWMYSPLSPENDPWTKPGSNEVCKYIINGNQTIEYDNDKPTWLAILVLSPSDFNNANPVTKIKQGTINDLLPATLSFSNPGGNAIQGTLPHNIYSQFSYLLENQYSGVPRSGIDPGIGQKPTDPCSYIDIPCTLFNTICPSIDDLEMMAHVRTVQMKNKPISAGQTVDQQESYSLVMANRLPESLPSTDVNTNDTTPAKGSNVAMLVSLEAMEFSLRGHTAGSYYDTKIASDANSCVRLPVLYNWSFTSQQDTSFEFESMLKGLNGRDPLGDNNTIVSNPQLRPPDIPQLTGGQDEQAIVQDMLESGYVPMNHLARIPFEENSKLDTVQTVSWYRGPFIPNGAFYPTLQIEDNNDPASSLIFSSDKLLRFDPNIGMYDASYAMAWQLGRLLALHNKDFSVPLYLWKKQVTQQFSVLHDDRVFENLFSKLLETYKGSAGNDLPGHKSTRKQLHKSILFHLSRLKPGVQ